MSDIRKDACRLQRIHGPVAAPHGAPAAPAHPAQGWAWPAARRPKHAESARSQGRYLTIQRAYILICACRKKQEKIIWGPESPY